MSVKILGIVGTPVKNGNCQYQVEYALEAAESTGDTETELIHLADYNIKYCIACEGCLRRVHKKQKEMGTVGTFDVVPVKEYNCGIKDDMEILHKKLMEADGIIIGAAVYILSVPGQLKTFIDRCRTFAHDYRLKGKVGAALSVAFFRHCGQEPAINVINLFFNAMMINVAYYGIGTVSTQEGTGMPIKDTRFAVEKDWFGMLFTKNTAIRVAEMAKIIKAGKESLNITSY